MVNIISAFLLSLVLSLLLTPLVARLGNIVGGLDWPNMRKLHSRPIPRTGGVAIFFAFLLVWYLIYSFSQMQWLGFLQEKQILFFLGGGFLVLGMGLVDDVCRLGYRTKFLFQILGATLAFFGGLRIEVFYLDGLYLDFGYLSYFVTLFWFVLLINAINLIDGLDGLAGGIIFFVCSVMVILLSIQEFHFLAVSYSILAGSVLGFLFYNFSPAKVFLGDSGSYFLGYMMAGLSIMGSVKSQVSTSILLPLLALGIPILDTLIAPVRRFLCGRKMFYPDKGHIHHRLLQMGFSTHKSVWIIYLLTMSLCLFSLFLVNIRNQLVALCLVVFGIGCIAFFQSFRKINCSAFSLFLENLENLPPPFIKTKSNEIIFEQIHKDIANSKDLDELWSGMTYYLKELRFDEAECRLKINSNGDSEHKKNKTNLECLQCDSNNHFKLHWTRNGGLKWHELNEETLYKFEFEIFGKQNDSVGKLIFFKDLRKEALPKNTMKYAKDISKIFSHTLQEQNFLSHLDN